MTSRFRSGEKRPAFAGLFRIEVTQALNAVRKASKREERQRPQRETLAQFRVGIRIAELRLPLENQPGSPSEFSPTGSHLMRGCRQAGRNAIFHCSVHSLVSIAPLSIGSHRIRARVRVSSPRRGRRASRGLTSGAWAGGEVQRGLGQSGLPGGRPLFFRPERPF